MTFVLTETNISSSDDTEEMGNAFITESCNATIRPIACGFQGSIVFASHVIRSRQSSCPSGPDTCDGHARYQHANMPVHFVSKSSDVYNDTVDVRDGDYVPRYILSSDER